MTLRRTLQRRIYVDDELPAFLTAGRAPGHEPALPAARPVAAPVSSALPPPVQLPGAIHSASAPASEPGRALMVVPQPSYPAGLNVWFMIQVAVLAVAINFALSVLLVPESPDNHKRLVLQLNEQPTTPKAATLEDRVMTFSRGGAFGAEHP